jgi:hypothetical protein
MHASVRIYRHLRDFDEVARRVETGLVPLLKAIPGFRGYYALRCGDDVGISIGLFATAQGAQASNEKGAAWARENLAEISDGQPPEMLTGEVLVVACG